LTSDDRIVPSLRCRQYKSHIPRLGQANFIAPNSVVIGNVKLGEKSSIWYGATVRGEIADVSIGKNSVV
jgi:carbonic anhydrase/acetyltransferase-like protein (isoleucine patch superfamily)